MFLKFRKIHKKPHLRQASSWNFIKKQALAQVFPFEFCQIF